MKTYYDRLNETFGFFESNILPSSAQLVMLYLLHFNNRFGNTGQFYLSDNRLSLLTNLSKGTITNTKRVLKNLGLIDFKSDKNSPRQGTLYILPEEATINNWAKNWAKRGQNWGKPWGMSSPMLADNSSSIFNNNIEKEKDIEGEGERARTRGQPPQPPRENFCSESVRICWIKNSGVNPNDGICQKLGELEKQHGTDKVESAIQEANYSDDGGGINLNFVIFKLKKLVSDKTGSQNSERGEKQDEYAGIWSDETLDNTSDYANLW